MLIRAAAGQLDGHVPPPSMRALILAVAPDVHVRELEREFLEDVGFTVEFAHDGLHGPR